NRSWVDCYSILRQEPVRVANGLLAGACSCFSDTLPGWVSFERPLKEDTEMKRHVVVALLLLATAASLAAQTPKGWRVRIDHSTSPWYPDAPASVKFVSSGS